MDWLGILALILAVAGLAGGILPILPGPPLSWVGLLCVYLSHTAKHSVSTSALIIWLAAAVVLTVLDYIFPSIMTKVTGGHKAAERGAMLGLLIGLFFTPVGMIMGSLLGAFLGEFLAERQSFGRSVKAALGAFLAFIMTTGMKVIFSAILLWKIIRLLFIA